MQSQAVSSAWLRSCPSAAKPIPASAHKPLVTPATTAKSNFLARKPLRQQCRERLRATDQAETATASSPVVPLSDAQLQPVSGGQSTLPTVAGVYAVYDKDEELQYIGLSRKVPHCLTCCCHPGLCSLNPVLVLAGGCQHSKPSARFARIYSQRKDCNGS